ncbi:TorD/DmsD family molecular chaperone [Xiamenia xianingshaonis]|uniref:Dehydrogenase n=1 Tax=Xiamenia xianingshaonis TaxID=2682776 RepID=A0ABX0IL17_9ACTN|nr:molecular chaperone TorD family protein [Xiamenia xianingshaonis]NHM13571.1 dehydrogenase [Xiamenia xianingshaonis]
MRELNETAAAIEPQGLDDLAALMDGVAASYGLLSRLYLKEPDDETVAALRRMRFPAHTGNEFLDRGYRQIVGYLSRTGAAAVEELRADYSRTFIGGGIDSRSAAYPYESVHRGRKRLMMQEARDEVLAIYRAYGLEIDGGNLNGEDHIAYELAFMEWLCGRCAKALRDGDASQAEGLIRAQANFLEDHLGSWVGELAGQMRYFSRTDFYQGVADVTCGVVGEHRSILDEVVDEAGERG